MAKTWLDLITPYQSGDNADANAGGGGTTTITSATEPTLNTGDQWHKEI